MVLKWQEANGFEKDEYHFKPYVLILTMLKSVQTLFMVYLE